MAQLIVAMDLPSTDKALSMSSVLAGSVKWLKIGLELFILGGPVLVDKLKGMGYNIFLDLKFYDIPNTVERAVKAAAAIEADMLTLHCQGGRKMCEGAKSAIANMQKKPLLFGVTVLTSFAAGEMPGINEEPRTFATSLAGNAHNWGLNGVVCSGQEVAGIKASYPDLLALCPGIRPAGQASNDQSRVVTPGQAVSSGADFIVVGRPITNNPNPATAASEILCEMEKAKNKIQ